MIQTQRLVLRPISLDGFRAILASDTQALPTLLQANVAPDWLAFPAAREAIPLAAQFLAAHPEAASWWSYFFIHTPSNTVIGLGGFSGLPHQGAVEIGYSIAPSFQGQGYATEAALGLVRFAFATVGVDLINAYTLPTPNGSTRVLTKVGFRLGGEAEDPQEGVVWAWRLTKRDYFLNRT